MDAYWRAANNLSVVQVYLYDNPLLKKPLAPAHIRARLLGHWGTTSGLNFIYIHLNRIIKKYDLNVINITGPSHVAPETPGAIHEGGASWAIRCRMHLARISYDELDAFFRGYGYTPYFVEGDVPMTMHPLL